MTISIQRQVLGLAGREVYFRYAGSGPPVVLFHESPRSSVALLPLMERLAPDFTVIGFDTPGFGGSDPLPMDLPSSADYADAMADAMNALGLKNVPVYGTHTGACIAMDLAVNHPDRVSVAVLDGYPVFSSAEKEELLRDYLPPFHPAWDGTHVAWLWARVRDQFTFFPWYAAGREGRLPRDPPGLDFHQLVVKDFLRAGDHYRPAYASAFRFEAIQPLSEVRVPVAITAREDDLLFPHLDRLPDPLPDGVAVHKLSADRDAWGAAIGGIMSAHPGQGEVALPGWGPGGGRSVRRRFVDTDAGLAHIRLAGPETGRPIVLLHRTPGWTAELDDQLARLGRHRPAVAIDLPGNGESDDSADTSLDGYLDWLSRCLAALDIEQCDLAGEYTGAAFAAAFAAKRSISVGRLSIAQAPVTSGGVAGEDPDASCPDLEPRWDGAHLMAAWYWARDSLLYQDWAKRRTDAAWPLADDPPLGQLHSRFVGAVLGASANAALSRAAFGASMEQHLEQAAGRGIAIDHYDASLAACRLDGAG